MAVTLAEILSGFCDFIQDRVVSSAATGGAATYLLDTSLSIYPDGFFEDYYVYITSGAAIGDVRKIKAFTKATGKVEPFVDFSALIVNGVSYQLKKTNTQDAIDAINEAFTSLYSLGLQFRIIVFESLGLSLLTSNANSGQKNVIVADESLFFVGQELGIKDSLHSEDCTIASITSATHTLTMVSNLTYAYTTANGGKVIAKSGKYFNLGATIAEGRIRGVYVKADATARRSRLTNWELIISSAGARQIYFPSGVSVDSQTLIIEAERKLETVTLPADTVSTETWRLSQIYAMTAFHFYDRQAGQIFTGDSKRVTAISLRNRDEALTLYKHLAMQRGRDVIDLSYDGGN